MALAAFTEGHYKYMEFALHQGSGSRAHHWRQANESAGHTHGTIGQSYSTAKEQAGYTTSDTASLQVKPHKQDMALGRKKATCPTCPKGYSRALCQWQPLVRMTPWGRS